MYQDLRVPVAFRKRLPTDDPDRTELPGLHRPPDGKTAPGFLPGRGPVSPAEQKCSRATGPGSVGHSAPQPSPRHPPNPPCPPRSEVDPLSSCPGCRKPWPYGFPLIWRAPAPRPPPVSPLPLGFSPPIRCLKSWGWGGAKLGLTDMGKYNMK